MKDYVAYSLSKCCCGILIPRLKILRILIADAIGPKVGPAQIVPDSDDSDDLNPPFCCDRRREKIQSRAKEYAHLDDRIFAYIIPSESESSNEAYSVAE